MVTWFDKFRLPTKNGLLNQRLFTVEGPLNDGNKSRKLICNEQASTVVVQGKDQSIQYNFLHLSVVIL